MNAPSRSKAVCLALFVATFAPMSASTAHSQQGQGTLANTSAPLEAPIPILPPLLEAQELVEKLEARLEVKRAELRECEIQLQQARRRLAIHQQAREREYSRAVERLTWAEAMHKKGLLTEQQLRLERQRVEIFQQMQSERDRAKTPNPNEPDASDRPGQ